MFTSSMLRWNRIAKESSHPTESNLAKTTLLTWKSARALTSSMTSRVEEAKDSSQHNFLLKVCPIRSHCTAQRKNLEATARCRWIKTRTCTKWGQRMVDWERNLTTRTWLIQRSRCSAMTRQEQSKRRWWGPWSSQVIRSCCQRNRSKTRTTMLSAQESKLIELARTKWLSLFQQVDVTPNQTWPPTDVRAVL